MTDKTPVPTEEAEQRSLMQWVAYSRGSCPELIKLYHIPNEGKRTQLQGARLKATGLRPGIPDLCLPVSRGGYHGLYIELKRARGSYPTPEQISWLETLDGEGYAACWCQGWEEAASVLLDYCAGLKTKYTARQCRGGAWHAGRRLP